MKWVVLAGLLALPGLACAQPRLVPSADADVVYRVTGTAADQIPGGAPDGVRLQWDAAGQRLRAYAIADLPRRIADVVFPAQTSILELPLRRGDPQSLLTGVDIHFNRRGIGHVLGLECAEWTVHSPRLDGTGCVTADGIVLRAEGWFNGQTGSLQAVSVARGLLPPGRFTPPEGFFRLPLMGGR
jgi:hypothetical protein